MGTWIEIPDPSGDSSSLPVVPLVGTWIEILGVGVDMDWIVDVVPLVGTWIEIPQQKDVPDAQPSCPSWARGLKSLYDQNNPNNVSRAPRGHVD